MERPKNALSFKQMQNLPDGTYIQFIPEGGRHWAWYDGEITVVKQRDHGTYIYCRHALEEDEEEDEEGDVVLNNLILQRPSNVAYVGLAGSDGWGFCWIKCDEAFELEGCV